MRNELKTIRNYFLLNFKKDTKNKLNSELKVGFPFFSLAAASSLYSMEKIVSWLRQARKKAGKKQN